MCTACNDGYTFTEVLNIIKQCWLNNIHGITKEYTCSFKNLIKQGIFYHKELRVQPKPCTVELDYNTGTMVSHKSEYFVEMVASYTLDDLIDYLESLDIVDTVQFNSSRINGLLKYYIKKYGIELTLFMIDAANDSLMDKGQKYPLDKLDEFYPKAVTYLNNIRNNCISNGGNTICPKKRF